MRWKAISSILSSIRRRRDGMTGYQILINHIITEVLTMVSKIGYGIVNLVMIDRYRLNAMLDGQ